MNPLWIGQSRSKFYRKRNAAAKIDVAKIEVLRSQGVSRAGASSNFFQNNGQSINVNQNKCDVSNNAEFPIAEISHSEISGPHVNIEESVTEHYSAESDDSETFSYEKSLGEVDSFSPANFDLAVSEVEQYSINSTNSPVQSISLVESTLTDKCVEGATSSKQLWKGLQEWALKHNVKHTVVNGLLKVLHPFDTSLPLDARTLLKAGRTDRNDCFLFKEMSGGEYLYMGIADSLKWLLLSLGHPDLTRLNLSFNIDGQSPFKNTKDQLWPILCCVEDLGSDPLFVGAYFGKKKPNVEEFLEDFIEELSILCAEGLQCSDGKVYEIKVHSFVCDAPAAAGIKCVKGHAGYYGCSKCFVKGQSVDGCRVFHKLKEKLRTDENFRKMLQKAHHHCVSPLTALCIDMVANFPLDPMHLLYLGCVKRLCKALKEGVPNWIKKKVRVSRGKYSTVWVKKKGKHQRKKGKLSSAALEAIDREILHLKKLWPSEFSRQLRVFSEFDLWKATECRQFLLYAAPVVLKGILDKERYNHFLLLHAAARILSSESLVKSNLIDEAQHFLYKFVVQCQNLYGPQFTVYNIHGLIHLVDDVRLYGCLDKFSAFKFENFQRELRDLLRGTYKPLQQLRNRLLENRSKPIKLKPLKSKPIPLQGSELTDGPTCGMEGEQFSKLCLFGTCINSTTEKDSTLILKSGTVIKAQNFIKCDGLMYVIGRAFCSNKDFYHTPIKSSKVLIKIVSQLSNNLSVWPVSFIAGKAMIFKRSSKNVVLGLLHDFC